MLAIHSNQNPPPMRLEFFRIPEIELSESPDAENAAIFVDMDFSPIQTDTEGEPLLGLEVELFLNKRRRNTKIRGYIKSVAFFEFEDDIPVSARLNLLLGNGLAMVYSLLRGVVYQKSTSIHPDNRLLPTLNLTELIQHKIETIETATEQEIPRNEISSKEQRPGKKRQSSR